MTRVSHGLENDRNAITLAHMILIESRVSIWGIYQELVFEINTLNGKLPGDMFFYSD